jgi:murein L,D-transpeptidase YcbB/YkuD
VLLVALALGGGATHAAGGGPDWFVDGRPGAQARQAVAILATADTHGLEPQDYGARALTQAVEAALVGPAPDAATAERLNRALTDAMQRYLAELHGGRVDPRKIHQNFDAPPRGVFDAAATLRSAVAAQRLPQAAQEAAPRLPIYERLRGALASYRAMGEHPAWQQRLPVPVAKAAAKSQLPVSGAPAGGVLVQRLVVLGDLPAAAEGLAPSQDAVTEALKRFQLRHGLTTDGVLGKATWAQLEVAPQRRARQIELTMERLRWTPLMQGPRMVVVNIPEFVLRTYEVQDDRIGESAGMKVIVGRALDHRTPVFDEDMRFIEFSPYWNVPISIARAETIPRLRRDPGYLERQGFEFVTRDGQVSGMPLSQALDAVLAGQLRIRQRPGPHNALGDIKFVFPNRDNIYLHHTPSTGLFERDRRDLSHGCIRVERPEELAQFVLRDMPDWTPDRIKAAMEAGKSSTLKLTQPLPVLIAYGTALVIEGRTHFFDDIYGHDRVLDAALRKRAR